MFRIYFLLLLANSVIGFTIHRFSVFTPPVYNDDIMDDGEIPWDFLHENCTHKKRMSFWRNPFSHLDDPREISFLFI